MSELSPDEPSIETAGAARTAEVARGGTDPVALFVDDDELRRRINPKMGRDRFCAAVRAAEQRGFPKTHSLWRGRYWPAVREWLDSDNGLGKNGFNSNSEDGPEHFNAPAR